MLEFTIFQAASLRILALDTSAEACSVALYQNGEVAETFELLPRLHTQHLLPMVDDLLNAHSLRLSDIDRLAFGCGPGSFTGLRVAASCVQGLSLSLSIPVVAISSLRALAQSARDFYKTNTPSVLALMDARMDEVYWAQFALDADGFFSKNSEERVSAPEDVCISNTDTPISAVGSGCGYLPRMSVGAASENLNVHVHAASIATLAALATSTITAEQAQPVYLRNSVAQTLKERQEIKA